MKQKRDVLAELRRLLNEQIDALQKEMTPKMVREFSRRDGRIRELFAQIAEEVDDSK